MLSYRSGHYRLLGRPDMDEHCFRAGDVFEVLVGAHWQVVQMNSGGYKGWYLETAEGQRTRPALCMKARLVDQRTHATREEA